jgi:hypothetical protein
VELSSRFALPRLPSDSATAMNRAPPAMGQASPSTRHSARVIREGHRREPKDDGSGPGAPSRDAPPARLERGKQANQHDGDGEERRGERAIL